MSLESTEALRPRQSEPSDATLWRFMGFAAFVNLVQTGKLYLGSLNSLSDPWEGQIPTRFFRKGIDERFAQSRLYQKIAEAGGKSEPLLPYRLMKEIVRRNTFVSCWYGSSVESESMWKIYGGPEGIAIQASRSRLEKVMRGEGIPLSCAPVEYIDLADPGAELELGRLAMYKRREFSHEREVRFVYACEEGIERDARAISNFDLRDDPDSAFWYLSRPDRREVTLDLKALGASVVTSPESAAWFTETVAEYVKRAGLGFAVRKSRLAELPTD